MPTTDEELDRLAAKVGFQFKAGWDDFLYTDAEKATKKANALFQFIDVKKRADTGDARAQLLGGTAFAGANATPEEISAFKPGRPLDRSTRPDPTPGLPEGTVDPALEADLQTQLRDEELNRAGTKNAPQVEAINRSLLMHDAGLNEAAIAQARATGQHERLYGAQADITTARRDALQNVLADPNLDPLLKNEIAQNKISFKSQRVKVQRKDGTVGYYDSTPNLSGGYDYTAAVDEAGNPLTAPAGVGAGDRPTALQKNAAFIARVLFADDPDAEQKAVTMLTQLKGKSPRDAWAVLTQFVAKLDYGTYATNPEDLHNKTAELWRVSRPGEPIPASVRPTPPTGAAAAPAAKPATPVAAPATTSAMTPAPADLAQRRAGVVYSTPRGPMKWTGTGWLPPN